MLKLSTLISMVILVFGAFGLYMVKYKVQTIKREVAQTRLQLAEEKRNLHVLEAEWAFLNRPQRLKVLSEKYLEIKPMRGQQIAEFRSIPYKGTVTAQKRGGNNSTLVNLVNSGPENPADSDNDE